jgi:hypothetical protein
VAAQSVALSASLLAGCSGGGDDPSTVAGPTTTAGVAADPARGAVLQLRAVEEGEVSGDCGAIPAEPDPQQTYSALYLNQCVGIGVAEVSIGKAGVFWERDATVGPVVRLTLSGPDVQAVAGFTQRHLNKRIAVVGLGRLLSLTTVQTPVTDGHVSIVGVSENDARRLQSALT